MTQTNTLNITLFHFVFGSGELTGLESSVFKCLVNSLCKNGANRPET